MMRCCRQRRGGRGDEKCCLLSLCLSLSLPCAISLRVSDLPPLCSLERGGRDWRRLPPSVRPPSRSSSTHSRSHALSDQEWPLNACFLACLLSWIGTRMDGSRTTSRWFRRRMICVCRPSESWTGRITPSIYRRRSTATDVAFFPSRSPPAPAPFSLRVGRLISFPLLDLLSSRRYFSVDIAFVIKFGRRIRPRSGAGQSVAGSDPCSDPPLAARNYIF